MFKITSSLVFGILATSLIACSTPTNKPTGESRQSAVFTSADSLLPGHAELAGVCSLAIADYIDMVFQKDKTRFDTLFLGQQFDFVSLELPDTIRGVQIRLLKADEIERKKSVYSPSSPFINFIGFWEQGMVDFVFVAFYPGFAHQFDAYLGYTYRPETKQFELTQSRIEVLVRSKEGKADHFAVYENGRHTGNKPVKGDKK
ncbi:MAG: hypothetical protein SFV22_07850 [Saprospiraceae bacterium]|nr:hypothetical protein [Saprospiraceae bacterium]